MALVAGLLGGVSLEPHSRWRALALVLVGTGIGAVLLRTAFDFAGAFRALIERRDAAGFRAHAAMLSVATALMMSLLAMGRGKSIPPPARVYVCFGARHRRLLMTEMRRKAASPEFIDQALALQSRPGVKLRAR